MPCYHPLKAMRSSSGVTILNSAATIFNLQLPCGQCVGCRLERSRQWALRCVHEASLYENNCFVTLTYDDDHLPDDLSLHYEHFQAFMKRLRRTHSGVRFYMCGEYGSDFSRPHYHAILFNCNFADYTLWRKTDAGSSLYRSATLERLWPFGFSSIGNVTFESAAYVSRYIMKKVTGSSSDSHYESLDPETGEIVKRTPEFNRMSLKPGIGAGWFEKFSSDVFPRDAVIHDGTPNRVPRYYDKLFSSNNEIEFDSIKSKRVLDAMSRLDDNTPQRLITKETVVNAKLSKLKRSSL